MDKDGSKSPPGKGGQKKQRTIQVKIGGQAAKTMTPTEAADYLKTIASKGAFGGAREMKLTFGKGGTATASVGPATSSKLPGPSFLPTGSRRKDPSMPCSEKEMKALMSMFVEIMGLQMNTDKLNKPRSNSKNLFKFPDDLPPPPGGWPEMWPHDNDDDSVDSVPELMDFDPSLCQLKNPQPVRVAGKAKPPCNGAADAKAEPVTGMNGIVPLEWDSLERLAIEDAMEQEERARKLSAKSKDTKKSWKKEKARKEAQAKAQEELNKKREKSLASWKARVSSSMQSLSQLEEVLAASPFQKDDLPESRKDTMEALLPLCVPKNRQSLDKGRDVRLRLVAFILEVSPESALTNLRNGRSLFHTACFYADVRLMHLIMSLCPASVKKDLQDLTCLDSGFTPLHYAAVSSSFVTVEALLSNGFPVNSLTNDTHTWRASNGKGFTPRQLLECLVQKNQKEIESHGMALPEVTKSLSSGPQSRYHLALMERLLGRLRDVESQGYKPLSGEQIAHEETLAVEAASDGLESNCSRSVDSDLGSKGSLVSEPNEFAAEADEGSASDTDSGEAEQTVTTVKAAPTSTNERVLSPSDPLVAALLQMGFGQKQITEGIKACGGAQRATADEVVAWIFNQETSVDQPATTADDFTSRNDDRKSASKETASSRRQKKNAGTRQAVALRKAEEDRLAAERLATKREEQRRRNREWNSRTQARQLHEVQAQLSKATLEHAPTLLTGLDLTPGSPKVTRPNATESSHGPSLTQSVPNDASTIGSIVEINVEVNDDQTVSTLGSWQPSRPPPMPVQPFVQSMSQAKPSAQQMLPPGFGQGMLAPPSSGVTSSVASDHMGRDLIPPNAGLMSPSGLLDSHSMFTQSTGREDIGMSRLSDGHVAVGGSNRNNYPFQSNHGLLDPTRLRTSPPIPTASDLAGFGSMGLSGPALDGIPHLPSHGATGLSAANRPIIPAPSPIGFALETQQRSHAESSFIDSFSTGAAVLNDAALWGDHRGGNVSGSSLLGNVIQSNSNMRGAGVIGGGLQKESSVPLNPFAANETAPGWTSDIGRNQSQSSLQRPDGSIW